MLIVRLFTVNGNLYSTSFCISAILEWEFRSDSISRCFCCWRLVRPAGDPAAEDDALFARGKSQLILLGSPGPRPYKVLACCSSLSPVLPGRSSTARTGCPGAAPSPTRRARREASMGLPPPPPVPPPPPPPPGASSMARRRRRSASSETQVHK